jgi:hypothetical protein
MKKATKWNGKKSPTTLRKKNGSGSNGAECAALVLLKADFALHCRRLRTGMCLTQAEFGKLLGYGKTNGYVAISRLERGEHKPQQEYLVRFMEIQNRYDNQV